MNLPPNLAKASFSVLIATDSELIEARTHYAKAPAEKRHLAADFAYQSSVADDFMHKVGLADQSSPPGSGAVTALAIDPDFAPALLTVGTLEYQFGRPEEAMKFFHRLTALPCDTDGLVEIIDHAGSFLIGIPDFFRAEQLYAAAAASFPKCAVFPDAIGYCAAKTGRKQEAVLHARRAAELDPSSEVLSDLGWSLVEAGEYGEARKVLNDSIALKPENDRARANLGYLESIQPK